MGRILRFLAPRTVAVEDRPVPEPDGGELLVEASVSAISSGTELLVYRGDAPSGMAADEFLSTLDGDLSYPLSYGYAAVGRVAAVGDGVSETWLDRRVFAFAPHASHVTVPATDAVPVPEGLEDEAAALFASAETAVTFGLDASLRVGETCVVFGQGVVGLLTTALLARTPLSTVLTVDHHPLRREQSVALGADESVTPGAVHEVVAERFADGVDLAVEVSGRPAALDDAVATVGYGGRVLVGSWYGTRRASLGLGGSFHRDRISIESSQVTTLAPSLRGRWSRERRWSVTWDALSSLDAAALVTHRIPFDDAPRAYRLLDQSPEAVLGVVFGHDG